MPQVHYRVLGRNVLEGRECQSSLVRAHWNCGFLPSLGRCRVKEGSGREVIFKPPTSDAEFLERLHLFLAREGWTVQDVARVLGFENPAPAPGPDMPAEMLNYILDNVIKPLIESIWYKKLTLVGRTSGAWGGTFEPWLEHANEVIEEWQVSDIEKEAAVDGESSRPCC